MVKKEYRIGVISDTHGMLSPAAMNALSKVDWIIHAGDIGGGEIITRLEAIAPVVTVRGNTDSGVFSKNLSSTNILEVENKTIYVLHDLSLLDLDPVAAGIDVVISGHTHRPSISEKEGILFFNPGSAGPARAGTTVSLGILSFKDETFIPRVIYLDE